MRSSSGAYFAGLDHVRGIAAFLVIVWHFSHWTSGYPVPFNRAPLLAPLDEGYIGVAVFMTLSGYLFAKLIGQRDIRFWPFIWNRAIRLAPLLILVILVAGISAPDKFTYLKLIVGGALLPNWPNGGWSITVEGHFYLLLPFLLALRRRPAAAFLLVGSAIMLRLFLASAGFDIQMLGYTTIVGRFDQFALGMSAFYLRGRITGPMAAIALASLWAFYAWFDAAGGYYNYTDPKIWIIVPTIEAATVAVMIAWYDRNPLSGRWTWILQRAGQYSYSIYLIHFFIAPHAARLVNEHIMPIPTLILALPWAVLFFGLMMIVGHLSWRFIEEPPLRFRKPYIKQAEGQVTRPSTVESS